jgi:flagellar biogenesis protein FliO
MNPITFQKLEKMNKHCKACVKAYALLTLLSLVTFFIYFFNRFTLEILVTDTNALFPAIKMEALALGIMHIVYCFF